MTRTATVARTTGETAIRCTLDLDGEGTARVATGLGFLDHMLTALARHGVLSLALTCEGDLIGVIAYLDDVPVDLDAICALVGEEVVVGLTVTDPATGASDRFERTLITAPDPDDPC